MMSRRTPVALFAIALALSACSAPDGDDHPVITRALLPPANADAPEATTTTTTRILSPSQADRVAQMEIRRVLGAAEELYALSGSYDANLDQVAALTPGIEVATLEDAALTDGVAYDAYDQRLALYRQSSSGRWFCADVTDDGTDHGFGDSFEQALETCTDGVRLDDWEDVFSPDGPDEAAIKAVLGSLANALAAGDSQAAHATFESGSSCPLTELQAFWPPGLVLIDADQFELRTVTIAGDEATADVSFGPISHAGWRLRRDTYDWSNAGNPCELIGQVAVDQAEASARDLLEQGLLAVRNEFVYRTDFAFNSGALENLDPNLVWVPTREVTFGTLAYTGSQSRGMVVTAGAPGRFYCAVESLSAVTVYGEGETIDDIRTVDRCRAHATS